MARHGPGHRHAHANANANAPPVANAYGNVPVIAADPNKCMVHANADAEARCGTCQRPLCSTCIAYENEGAFACGACEYRYQSAGTTRIATSLVLAAIVFASLIGVAVAQVRLTHQPGWWALAVAGVVVLIGLPLATWILRPEYAPRARVDVSRLNEGPSALGSPYRVPGRSRARVLARALVPAPPLSGKGTAAALGACMLITALAVPFALHQPSWVDFEAVIGGFWIATTATLAYVLYRGSVSDDYAMHSPRMWFKGGGGSSGGSSWWSNIGSIGDVGDAEGCAGAIIGVIAFIAATIVLIALAWLFVELLLPLMLYVSYTLLCGAIRHVSNDRHGCENKLPRAMAYATLWSTVYLAPFAAVTWAAHAYLRVKHGK